MIYWKTLPDGSIESEYVGFKIRAFLERVQLEIHDLALILSAIELGTPEYYDTIDKAKAAAESILLQARSDWGRED